MGMIWPMTWRERWSEIIPHLTTALSLSLNIGEKLPIFTTMTSSLVRLPRLGLSSFNTTNTEAMMGIETSNIDLLDQLNIITHQTNGRCLWNNRQRRLIDASDGSLSLPAWHHPMDCTLFLKPRRDKKPRQRKRTHMAKPTTAIATKAKHYRPTILFPRYCRELHVLHDCLIWFQYISIIVSCCFQGFHGIRVH